MWQIVEWWIMTLLLIMVWLVIAVGAGYWVGWLAKESEDEWRHRR